VRLAKGAERGASGCRAASGCLDITVDELKSIILKRIAQKFHAVNLCAVDLAAADEPCDSLKRGLTTVSIGDMIFCNLITINL
jgi:hypothetical protein